MHLIDSQHSLPALPDSAIDRLLQKREVPKVYEAVGQSAGDRIEVAGPIQWPA